MVNIKKPSVLEFILFPAVAMMLGWGLRGYIGGGPFGAMIPGAIVAICLSILLKLPLKLASVVAVFGVVGIGLGGEMTYGQTLGFLRNPDTMWWGTLGTTVKGAVWGLLGGIVIGIGLIYNRLSAKSIIIAFLLLLAGMLAGFKLINQPMIIYFSDPANPRSESWGALLVGAITLLAYLKVKTDTSSFKIITRFAVWGLVGGGLGFGLGGFWMVLGSRLPDNVIYKEWWKAMEFTFGLLLGGFFGFAAWLSRGEIVPGNDKAAPETDSVSGMVLKEFGVTLLVGVLIFWAFSSWLDPIVDAGSKAKEFTMIGIRDIAIIFSNYAFFGLLMVVAVMYFPFSAWQIAVTLTFCHTIIDLVQDIYPDTATGSQLPVRVAVIFIMTFVIAALTSWIQRSKNVLHKMLLLLVWSTVTVAFLRLFTGPEIFNISGLSFCELVCGRFFVHIIFLTSALAVTVISFLKNRKSP